MRALTVLGIALLVALFQVATAAEARDQFNQKDAVTIDPQKSYIFYRTRLRLPVRFMREASPEDERAWVAVRAAALVQAQQRYEAELVRYRRSLSVCRGQPSSCRTMDEPVRPTEENFDFPPAETGNFVVVTHAPLFHRDGDEVSYLIAVPPGTYVVYGTTAVLTTGVGHMCQCMGTVRFAAPAGQIVDLGTIYYPRVEAGMRVIGLDAPAVRPYAPAMTRPPRLSGLPVIPAELRAVDKIPNYFGGMIDRHPALPGVLRYERDRVIDDRTGQAPADPPRP
jgi:hypothetical protein